MRTRIMDNPSELLDHLFELGQHEGLAFRGMSREDDFYPSIMRCYLDGCNNDFSAFEKSILTKYIKYGGS